ncbi:DEAD/DEAH box helicase [Vibrio campbellii]|uniref:DEAD/DEAH box helicase n=1 Tax=Vibrio campbellii TaxID=680 RepID=UPI0005F05366|nr:ATP-binding domain-containing protein [Vibrio campbellii]
MNIIPKSFDVETDLEIKYIIQTLSEQEQNLGIEDSLVFLEFPLYKDDNDSVVMTQALLVSPEHGIFIIYSSGLTRADQKSIKIEEAKLDKVAGHITSKLFKNDKLRSGLMGLSIPVYSILLARHLDDISQLETTHPLVHSRKEFLNFIETKRTRVNQALIEEAISSLQGAKGLLRPAERNVDEFDENSKVAKIHQVESKILKFDNEQQDGYIPAINGPHRIRGLAGSGKTVILAMKVVQTLLREKDRSLSVLYTFSTKSLYQHVQRLIHRFYREFHDDMSYLDCVKIMHAWGGHSNAGVYYNACLAHNIQPLTLTSAQNLAPIGVEPFEFACQQLLESTEIKPMYDYVFVDEAQDYSKSYLLLCTKLAKGNRVTLGADVFQNIFQKRVPTAKEIFGESSTLEFQQDDFLETCYRTPLSVLVTAHSIGLGVYGERQVQKIESVDLWSNLGYEVASRTEGNFEPNEKVVVQRSESKSPTLIEEKSDDLIKTAHNFPDMQTEIAHIANQVIYDIQNEGLLPEDILVICMDDRRCGNYFNLLTDMLLLHGVQTNNIHANKYSIKDFQVKGRVTLSTVHKAKGNEAYSVYIMGCDYVCHNLNTRNRNLLFTAMTRTKGWLSLTGYGSSPTQLFDEITNAKNNSPRIEFNYPSQDEVERIETDLKRKSPTKAQDIVKLKKMLESVGGAEELERMYAEMMARDSKK